VAAIDPDGLRVRLDQSAFYPTSGGQPHDTGTIEGIAVKEVLEEETGDVIHVLASPLPVQDGAEVDCRIASDRRFDHMQQHTGQHLLSAVLEQAAHAPTVSFHMSADVSTIDLGVSALDGATLESAELRCNQIIAENRPVRITYEHASAVTGLRKATDREGTLRIVTIDGLDISACGGTHVRFTGEIGCILVRSTEKIRSNLRLEFVCGLRAIRRARADYDALSAVSRAFSSAIDDTPKLAGSLLSRVTEAEKQRARLSVELAGMRGREAWREAVPDSNGLRLRVIEATAISDEVRAEAQAFTAGGKAAAIVWCANPASVLLSCSADSGLHAGNLLKAALTARGGRGGGSAQIAQGGVPSDARELSISLEQEINRTAAPR
jgi:alanyl-tRNA synthetase